ncbi:MAG: pseudouridine synthase [Patescibacteria group bacterium]|jgi:23S rRNA pseudouridine2605 synthase
MRLNRYIASSGLCSRRKADELIQSGKVRVNGVISEDFVDVNVGSDKIEYLTAPNVWAELKLDQELVVYALNKPLDYVCSALDAHNAKLVIDLVPKTARVFPVGRLDKDSTGLLLLTNDGDLTNKLTSPAQHIQKTYLVKCHIPPNYNRSQLKLNLKKLSTGIVLDGYPTLPAKIKLREELNDDHILFEMTLFEGKNRQIRRMCQKIGLNVVELSRVSIGGLQLSDLKIDVGHYIKLNNNQIKLLLK